MGKDTLEWVLSPLSEGGDKKGRFSPACDQSAARQSVYKCIYNRPGCPSMNAVKRQMPEETANVTNNARCGPPLPLRRPVEGRGDGEGVCVPPPETKGKIRGLGETSDFGPAPGPQPTIETARTGKPEGDVAAGLAPPLVGTSPVTLRVIEAEPAAASQPVDGLTETDLANLSAVLDHEVSRNTVTNYRAQWRCFMAWVQAKGIRGLPAEPTQVAAYLAERLEEHGHSPATLRMAASAIAFVHKAARMDDPCASLEVKRTLRSATRRVGRSQKQAEALTEEAFAAIRSNSCEPRRGRGGRLESQETARCRGMFDIALISLMRDAMLRVSEAAALSWSDIATEADGTGRLLIRRSKTDAEGEGAVVFLSAPTMSALRLIQNRAMGADSVFGLRPNQISTHIKQAAKAAGLGDGFSGHSPRVGMARDLARAGIELTSLMNAGRWRTATMPAHYTRNEAAGKGAVAQFHGYCRQAA